MPDRNNVSRTSLRRCWRRLTTIQICSKTSLLVTNHGCMVMTSKPKPHHPDRQKHTKFGFAHCFLQYYLQVISRLRKANSQKCKELLKRQPWILHHDKAPAHTSMLVREFFSTTIFTELDPFWFFPLPKTEDTYER